jgi:hypothetical protein
MKIFYIVLIVLILVISACVQTAETPEKSTEPVNGGTIEESGGINEETPEEVPEVKEMSAEVKQLLSIADTKVESLRYSYKGPQTGDYIWDFVVKGDNIKYFPIPDYKTIDIDDDAYDTIYINKESKTVEGYCDARKCHVKGKKADLNYDDVYVWTPLDWLENIEYAEKIGEELIGGRRSTWKLSTSNLGTVWVDSFYGVPLQAELEGNKYQFLNIVFNDVTDEEVTPQPTVVAEEEEVSWECPNLSHIDCTLPIPIDTQKYCIGEYADWINENCNITITY